MNNRIRIKSTNVQIKTNKQQINNFKLNASVLVQLLAKSAITHIA